MKQRTVGILLFNEVEVLDFAGPFEVFSVTELPDTEEKPFNVVTISETGALIQARNGLKVQTDYSFTDHPKLDILVVPGGYGARKIEIENKIVHQWINKQNEVVDYMTSVCTGAFLLAKAGLLKGKRVTTHFASLDKLQAEFPDLTVVKNTKFVDEGQLITSAGISAGIEMALHLVGKILGEDVSAETAYHMEYNRQQG